MKQIYTLAELVKSGIENAVEDDRYYYILPKDPNRDHFDQSFYLYDKDTGNLERTASTLDFIREIENSKPLKDLSIFESLI